MRPQMLMDVDKFVNHQAAKKRENNATVFKWVIAILRQRVLELQAQELIFTAAWNLWKPQQDVQQI